MAPNAQNELRTGSEHGSTQPLSITYLPISSLIPYARNARTHSDVQVAEIAASIAEFGWTNPVLVDGSCGIIAGHGRVLAARKLGMTSVPVIELAGLSEAQKRACILANNKLALNAGWDDELLGLELIDLNAMGFGLALTGIGEDEVAKLLASGTPGLTDPDDVPDAPAEPVSRMGDLWLLGRHRLLCGDSTNAGDVSRVLAGVSPHLMVTDPPYGVSYDPAWRVRSGVGGAGNVAVGTVLNDDRADWREAWALFPGDVAYVWHGGLHAAVVADSLIASGFALRSQIIWDKGQLVLSRGDYHWSHEPCWYAVRERAKGHWLGDRKQTTVWQIPKPKRNETGHSTQKLVECMRRPVENNSSPGQAIYEPFSDSGTTIVASCGTSRRRGIHLGASELKLWRWPFSQGNPVSDRLDHELRPVVGTNMVRHATQDEGVGKHVDHIICLELASVPDLQALAGYLVDHVQHPEPTFVVSAIFDEVVGPNVIGPLRPQPNARAVVEPDTTFLRLFARHFEPLPPPDSLHPLGVWRPPCILR